MYQEIRSFRHDIKNHLLSLNTLLNAQEITHAQQYIAELLEKDVGTAAVFIETGNELLDAILGAKLSMCRKEQIQAVVDVQDNLGWMDAIDLTSLLGNLLDNAIEGCSQADSPKINLKIAPQGSYVLISIQNRIARSVLTHNPSLRTTKREKSGHGYGVRNIRKIVEQYQGMLEYYERDNMLCCEIMLLPAKTAAHTEQ